MQPLIKVKGKVTDDCLNATIFKIWYYPMDIEKMYVQYITSVL